MNESCIYGCGTCNKYTKIRGKDYFVSNMDKKKEHELKRCVFTFWHLTHYITYTIIGYLFPIMFIESVILGTSFEIFEYLKYDCHDALDVVYNALGFVTGYFLRKNMDFREKNIDHKRS